MLQRFKNSFKTPSDRDRGGMTGRLGVMALEPRFMFDAAGMVTVAETVNDPPLPGGTVHEATATDSKAVVAAEPPAAHTPPVQAGTPAPEGPESPAPQHDAPAPRNVVFVDTSVNDYQTLIADIPPGSAVVLLDPDHEAFGQMAGALAGMANLDSIQVVSHGGQGHLYIAGRVYWTSGLENRAADLEKIGAALRPGGDILFYACNVGAGENGQDFATAIHRLTGADVAVSSDGTGNGDGKNWTLETHIGAIEASSPFAARSLAAFSGSLETRTVTLASGTAGTDKDAGSLNYQLTNAADGDVIVFAESLKNATVSLGVTTSLLSVSAKGVTINGDVNGDGIADVTVSGDGDNSGTTTSADYRGLAFNAAGKTSTVKNLVFERFYAQTAFQGVLTLQNGSLVVDGVTFKNNLNNVVMGTTNGVDMTVKNSIFHHNTGEVTGTAAFSVVRSLVGGTLTVENTVIADNIYTMNAGQPSADYRGGIINHTRTLTGTTTVNIINSTIVNNTVTNNNSAATGFTTASIGLFSLSTGSVANIYNNIIMGNSGGNGGTAFSDGNVITSNSTNITINRSGNYSGSETSTAKLVDATNANLNLRDYRPHADATDFINKGDSSNAAYYAGSYDIRGIDRIRDGALDIGAYEVRWNAGDPDLDLGGTGKNTAVSSTNPSAGVTVAASAAASQTDTDTRLLGATVTLTGVSDTGKESLSLDAASARTYGIAGTLSNGGATLTLTGAASLANYQAVLRLIQYQNTATAFTAGARTVTITVNDGETTSAARISTITLGTPVTGPSVTTVVRQTPSSSTTNADSLTWRVTFSEAMSNVDAADFSVSGTTASVTNVSSAGGNAYDVTVSGGDLAGYGGAVTLSLAGSHNIVSAGSSTTLADFTPTGTDERTYTLDNTAPTTTISSIGISADTGVSSSDFITKTAGQTITATLAAALDTGDILYGSVDGGTTWIDITAKVSGTAISWTGATLGTGSSSIKFKVTDAVGNDGPVATQSYTLDTTAPSQTITIDSLSDDTGVSSTDFITKTASQTINATVSGALGGTDILYGSVDGGTTWTDITAKVSGTAIAWTGATLGAGAGSITFKVTDAAGNEGTAAAKAYTLDTTAPTASVTSATIKNTANVSTAQSSETGTVYLVPSNATITDLASLEALATGGTAKKATVSATNSDTTITTANLADGTYTVYAVDAAGNVSAAAASTITIDSTAPTLAATDTVNVAENATTVKTVSATDAGTVAYSIVAGDDGATFSIDASTGALTFTAAPDYETPTDVGGTGGDNTYVVTIRATDTAGNTADQTLTVTVTNVNEAPAATDDTGAATEKGGTANGSGGSNATGNVLTNDTDPDSGTARTVTAVRVGATEGSGTAGTAGQPLTGTYGSLTLNADGSYTYTVDENNATVQALKTGGTLTDSFNYTVSDGALTDTAVLTITINGAYDAPADATLSADSISVYDTGTNVTVGVLSATDADAGDTFTYAIQSVTDPSSNDVTSNALFTITGSNLQVTSPSTTTQGTYTLVVRVTDGGNLTYDKTLTVTVSDLLIVTTNSDSGDDAETDATYAAAVSDGGGLSLREALFLAQAGGKTIGFAAGLNGQTITLGANADVAAGTVFLLSGSSLTIAAQKLTLAGGLSVNAGSGDTLTINSTLGDAGAGVTSTLTKTGTGTLTLGGTNNTTDTGLSSVTVSAGTLSAAADAALGEGTITLGGGTLAITGAATVDNAIALTAASTIEAAATAAISGTITGSFGLTTGGTGTLSLSGTNSQSSTTVAAGTLKVGGSAQLGSGTLTLGGGGLEITGAAAVTNALTLTADGTLTNASDAEWSGLVSGGFALTKEGAGTLTLSNTGNSAGSATLAVRAGSVAAASDSRLVGGALTLNGGTLTVTGPDVTIDNAITLGTNHGTISNAHGVTLSGVISGTGNLTKSGAGTLTLGGANTYSGTSSFAGGQVTISADSNLGGGAVTLGTNGSLNITQTASIDNSIVLDTAAAVISVAADATATLTGVISETGGARGLNKSGAGTLVIGADATYTGATGLNGGVLELAATRTLATSGIALNDGSPALTITGNGTFDRAVIVGGTGTNSIRVDGNVTLSGLVSLDASATANRTVTKTGSGTLTLGNSGNAAAGSVTAGSDTHRLGLTVSAGTVSVAGDAHLMAGNVTLNGGGLTLANVNGTIDNAITLGASGGTVSVTGSAATLSGVISGSGPLTKDGGQMLTLSGDNTYTGVTFINANVVSITHANALGTTAGGTTVADGATLRIGNGLTVAENLTISGIGVSPGIGAVKINGGGSGSATVTGTVTLAADADIGAFNAGDTLTISGAVSGGFALTKVGAGTLALSGTNSWTGATTVSAGTLTLAGGSAIADTSAVTLSGTAEMVVGASETIGGLTGTGGNTITLDNSATLTVSQSGATAYAGAIVNGTGSTGGLTKAGTGTLTLSGNNSYTGATTVSAGGLTLDRSGGALADTTAVTVAAGAALTLNQSDTVASVAGAGAIMLGSNTLTAGGGNTSTAFSGVISGTNGNLVKTGTGTLTLSGANTYTGTTTVQGGGGLSVAGDGNLGSGALTIDASTLTVTGATTIDNAITLTGAAVIANSAAVTLSGALSGTGSLTMAGSAVLALSNTNTYSGATAVSSGTLHVGGALNATSGVSVAPGAMLSGTGTIFAASSANTLTVAADGFLAPGTVGTAGRLTVNGTLILNGTMTLDLAGAAAGTGYDQVVVNGAVTLGAASAFDVTYAVAGPSNNTFTVIDNDLSDAVSGTLNGVAEDGTLTSNSRNYKTSYRGGSGNDVTLKDNAAPTLTSTPVTAVNEDSAYTYTVTSADADGDAVTVTATTLPAWLTFANGVLSGTPAKTEVGTHTVVLTASDGNGGTATQSFTITVAFVNDAPVITTAPGGSVNEDGGYSYTIAASDEEGETVTYAATTLPSWLTFRNGVLNGTPGQADAGTHTVTLTATDASGAVTAQSFTITVNAVNDAPVFTSAAPASVNEDAGYSYTPTATDEEGSALTFTAVSLPPWLTFKNGALTGTPGQADAGTHTVTLTATDASGAATAQSFTITVNAVNDAPVFASTPVVSVNEKAVYSYTPTATDEEGSALTFTAVSLPPWLTFKNGTLTGTPGQADIGTHTVTLTATDAAGGVTAQSFTITVNAVNDAPVFTSTPVVSVNEKAVYSYTPTATDEEGSALTFTAVSLPPWLTFKNGTLSGTPGQADAGTHTVTLTAIDAAGAATAQTFTITVSDVNDAPVFSSIQPGNATAGQAFSVGLSASDPEGGTLSFGASGLPPWLTLTDNGNGTARLSGTPGAGDVGAVSVTVRVTDAGGAVTAQVLRFAVGASATAGTATALNITQLSAPATTSSAVLSGSVTGPSSSGTMAGTPAGGTGTNAGTGSTTVMIVSGGAAAGGALSGPGGSETGRDSPATVRVGNVDGNSSSATGIQQAQGLTTTVTSGDASASADGSLLVRNAARGDSAATSSFYGAGTILSLTGMNGGSSTGGAGGFGAGTSGGFGGNGSGSGFGTSAGGLGGGLGVSFSAGGTGGTTGGAALGSGPAATGGATPSTTLGGTQPGGISAGGGQSGAAAGTGTPASGQGAVPGRTGGEGQGQPVQRSAPPPGAPLPGGQPGQGNAGQSGTQPAPRGIAPAPSPTPAPAGDGQPAPQDDGQPAPAAGGDQPGTPAPGPQAGMEGLFRGQWTIGPQPDGPAPLPGGGISEQLAFAHLEFGRQTARLAAAAAALHTAA